MGKYFIGILGSLLHIIGIIFVCTSFSLVPNNVWGYVLIITGILFVVYDFFNLYKNSKNTGDKSYIFKLMILDIVLFIVFIVLWYIEVPVLKENRGIWNVLRSFLIFIFLLNLFIIFIYRNIIGYHFYNLYIQKTFIKINAIKFVGQFVFFILILIMFHLILWKWDYTLDLTPGYYSFSKNTKEIIATIKDANIKIFVFLPDQQLVQSKQDTTSPELYQYSEELKILFNSINKINPKIEVSFYNADLLESNNLMFGNVTNGTIIIRNYKSIQSSIPFTERRFYVYSSLDVEKLEQNLIRTLLQVSGDPVKVYFSTGYGERYTTAQKKPYNIDFFIDTLRIYNFEIYEWNELKGFPDRLPDNVEILVFAGPSLPLKKESQSAIIDYVQHKSGKLLIMIDSTGNETFDWLVQNLEIPYKFIKSNLLQMEGKPNFIYTDQIGVSELTQNIRTLDKPRILFTGNGYFQKPNQKNISQKSNYILKDFLFTTYTTWNDINFNLKKDSLPQENNDRFILGFTYEMGKSKIVFYSGVEWITNKYLTQNIYNLNLQLATDSIFYLANRMNVPGILEEKRENQNILIEEHTKTQIFIIGIVIIPLSMILTVGFIIYTYNKKHKLQTTI